MVNLGLTTHVSGIECLQASLHLYMSVVVRSRFGYQADRRDAGEEHGRWRIPLLDSPLMSGRLLGPVRGEDRQLEPRREDCV